MLDTIELGINEESKAFQGCDYVVITQPPEHNICSNASTLGSTGMNSILDFIEIVRVQKPSRPTEIGYVVIVSSPSPINKIGSDASPLTASATTNSSPDDNIESLKNKVWAYLDEIKFKYYDQRQVCNNFLDIMIEFKLKELDTLGVVTRLAHLFKKHPELFLGFNIFLPAGYKVDVQIDEQGCVSQVTVSVPHTSSEDDIHHSPNQSSVKLQQKFKCLKIENALSYLDQIKLTFNDQPQVWSDFLNTMKDIKFKKIDTPSAITKVSYLFRENPELLLGLNLFLPPRYEIKIQTNEHGCAYQVSVNIPESV